MAGYIGAEDLWKRFQLQRDRADSVGHLLTQMLPRGRRVPPEPFWALKGVSFEMQQGQSMGIIGNNGSGKSTLLKLLTRTMRPTSGSVRVHGRVSALIELGAGFHPDFTGRENVVLNASILGITRREIEKHMDEIVDFADIRSFIDVPVKYYSSGMQARLGFSVAIHVRPEILLVDEVLAVGDEAFQQKCMDRIYSLQRDGVSVLLVSHDLGSVERLTDRAIWIDRGVVRADGTPRDVIISYRDFLNSSLPSKQEVTVEDGEVTKALAVEEVAVGAGNGSEGYRIAIKIRNATAADVRAYVEVSVRRPDGLEVTSASSLRDGHLMRLAPGIPQIDLNLTELRLASGSYDVDVMLVDELGRELVRTRAACALRIHSAERTPGVVLTPHEWGLRATSKK